MYRAPGSGGYRGGAGYDVGAFQACSETVEYEDFIGVGECDDTAAVVGGVLMRRKMDETVRVSAEGR